MTLFSDAYFASNADPNSQAAFEDDSDGPDGVPVYRFGMVGYGSAGGVVGCGGPPITRLLGPYSTFAGVHGTAQDFTGVAGTSVNHVGVYGQVEKSILLSGFLHAGVLGTAQTQPEYPGFPKTATASRASRLTPSAYVAAPRGASASSAARTRRTASSAFPAR
jgi:hypothetical protein